jgi:hypothetical protein
MSDLKVRPKKDRLGKTQKKLTQENGEPKKGKPKKKASIGKSGPQENASPQEKAHPKKKTHP